ncbi:GNAT family N-acetyltransferase [Pseudomonas sp. SLFW]|uniref:GNAT family N-acetyltransferase n=1 Tax=Pseudomonas sp. SLFW TaxID=2683259 RepID=UPI001412C92F|nr:GNAT family N-acetyltransferase [Pseudomonas sp. SLFW]NBB08280.1 GNAT family N-acetyltransferase [Pseudomonas sp. SLFW]
MISTHAFSSIRSIDRDEWNDCFPGQLEDWDFYLAVEQAGVERFHWRYLAVFDGPRLLGVAPAFYTCYSLDTTMQGASKRMTEKLRRLWPRVFDLQLYAVGSPVAERCNAGVASHVPAAQRQEVFDRLLQRARHDADGLGIGLLAVKDAPQQDHLWANTCRNAGLQVMPSLPSALLPVTYTSLDAYLGSLGKSTRKDLRRTLRGPAPQIEWRRQIDDVLPDIMQLYEATLSRSDLQFERLGPAYFTRILQQLGERAVCVLYWVDNRLVAFNLMLLNEQRLIDKIFAHDLEHTRDLNLYARSWLANVEYCIHNRIPVYEAGQAGYASKIRFGCRFEPNLLFFRHRNRLLNTVLKLIKRVISPDRSDPALAAAISDH